MSASAGDQVSAIAAAAVGLVVVSTAWWISYSRNQRYLAEIAAELPNVQHLVGDTQSGLLPKLTGVRTLAETRGTPDGRVPWSWRFGLYQGPKLEAASQAAYQRMLRDAFLPAMAASLEEDLRRDQSYDTLKTYVMLYDPKRFNRETVWRWYDERKDRLFPDASADEQKILKTHFDTLYERGWVDPPRPRDDQLVAQGRSITPGLLPKRRMTDCGDNPPLSSDFTVAEKGGPGNAGFRACEPRASDKRRAGAVHQGRLPQALPQRLDPTALRLAEEEAWVLGTATSGIAQAASRPRLIEAVRRLYLRTTAGSGGSSSTISCL